VKLRKFFGICLNFVGSKNCQVLWLQLLKLVPVFFALSAPMAAVSHASELKIIFMQN